jgi:hypothetical protein
MIQVTNGLKLVYHGKELMLPGTVLTVKNVRTYAVEPNVFETMVKFEETGESEYNVRFFFLEFHGIKPGTQIPT